MTLLDRNSQLEAVNVSLHTRVSELENMLKTDRVATALESIAIELQWIREWLQQRGV